MAKKEDGSEAVVGREVNDDEAPERYRRLFRGNSFPEPDRENDDRPMDIQIAIALRRLGDELDGSDREWLDRMIYQLNEQREPQMSVMAFIRKFVVMISRYSTIPTDLIQFIIRAFLVLYGKVPVRVGSLEASAEEWTEMTNQIAQQQPSDSVDSADLPLEVRQLGGRAVQSFYRALKEGWRKIRDIRLMVVGMFQVGKTSLVENLLEETHFREKKPKVDSTVGIDVTQCLIKEEKRETKWVPTNQSYFGHDTKEKFKEIFLPSSEPTDGETQSKVVYSGTGHFEETTLRNDEQSRVQRQISVDKNELLSFTERLKQDQDEGFLQFIEQLFSQPAAEPELLDPVISVWDFAGQYIYYSTHHFFLNSRSVYLLLMDVSKPLDSPLKEQSDFPVSGFLHKEFTCLEAFKFWMNSIHMYSRNHESEIKPSVILIGTHKDELINYDTEEEKEQHNENYFNEALKSFIDTDVIKHVHSKKFLVDNLENNSTVFNVIRREVMKIAKSQTFWEEVRPAKWIPLERSLEKFKEQGSEIISFDELVDADKRNEVKIESEEDLRAFLIFQHSLGNVLFFETEVLKQFIILSPQWIVDAFRCFITHTPNKKPRQLHLWDNFEKKAILTPELIDEILVENEKNVCFGDYKKEIIEYMEHLDMIAKPNADRVNAESAVEQDIEIDFGGATPLPDSVQAPVFCTPCEQKSIKNLKNSFPEEFHIVPSLLKSRPADQMKLICPQNAESMNKSPVFCVKFNDGFMPPSVFHRLLAVCIKKWQIVKKQEQFLLFNGLGVFYITPGHTKTLTLWFHDNVIYARVTDYTKEQHFSCSEIRLFLVHTLKTILSILPKESRLVEVNHFEEFIQCPRMTEFEHDKGLLRMRNFLRSDEGIVMCEHSDLHRVERNEALAFWCEDYLQKQAKCTLPAEVLNRSPAEKELGRVSMLVGNEYFRLGLQLKVERAKLHQLRDRFWRHIPTLSFHILRCCLSLKKVSIKDLRNAMIAVESDVSRFDEVFDGSSKWDLELDTIVDIDFGRKPSEMDLLNLSTYIGDEYWLLGIELDLDEVQLQHLADDNALDMQVRIFKMLLHWKERDSSNIGALGKALRNVDGDVQKFYEVFKIEKADVADGL